MPTEARPQRRLPRLLAVAAVLAAAARLAAPSVHDRVSWMPMEEATASGRPIFYNFTAEWCAPCKRLEREYFANPRWAQRLQKSFAPVRVVDREREDGANPPGVDALQKKFGVDSFPTLVVARPDGSIVAKQAGYAGRDIVNFFVMAEMQAKTPAAPAAGSK